MKALCVSAIASNQGKTVLTMALLQHYKKSVRPFKIGPDFIDPQFHTLICGTPSVNLDRFMMNDRQIQWMFAHYSDKDISICEGVMGFYDGMDKGSSAYDLSKLLHIPTILLLDGSSSYITVSAVLKGLKSYKEDNTIKAVVLNKLSSHSHFELIKKQIEKDFSDITVLGWIKKDLPALSDTNLGLNLTDTSKVEEISKQVLEFIDTDLIDKLSASFSPQKSESYPFEKLETMEKKLVIVNDENFSFLYHDNSEFLKETFREVVFINACKDEPIPDDVDIVYIPGGYVETPQHYANIKNANNFKASLIKHAKNKSIYAECAGLLYLSNGIDDKKMSGILDLNFSLKTKFQRMGYYVSNESHIKGHAFHYTNVLDKKWGTELLYLHVMLRGNTKFLQSKFI